MTTKEKKDRVKQGSDKFYTILSLWSIFTTNFVRIL
uniref:Uncharacterized protein n=1 Tax=Rhizophora mucronata TaxID=61149 RepID=A0A2P2J7G1_RHIMU